MGIIKMIKSTLAMAAAIQAKISIGSCGDVKMIENFDKTRYVGKWFELVRDRMNPYSISSDCTTKEFALNDDGDVDLYFRGYYGLAGKYMGVNGELYQCDEGSPEPFTCMATMGGGSERLPFGIFYTDYETYDISYSCVDLLDGFFKSESFAVTTREMQPSDETMEKIKNVVAEMH